MAVKLVFEDHRMAAAGERVVREDLDVPPADPVTAGLATLAARALFAYRR